MEFLWQREECPIWLLMLSEQREQLKRLKLLFDLNGRALSPFDVTSAVFSSNDLCLEKNIKFLHSLLVADALNSVFPNVSPFEIPRLGARAYE